MAKKNSFRKNLLIFASLGLILGLGLLFLKLFLPDKLSISSLKNQIINLINGKAKELVDLSPDQQKLVDSFGQPDVFRLTTLDDIRHEIWTYYDYEKSFIFINGQFVEDQFIDPLSDKFLFPEFKITYFKAGMSLDEVKKILGEPSAGGELDPEILENAKLYDFYDQVKVGFKDDKLIFVQTLPVFIPEEYRVE